ncbi:unnamed protein product [marine sediment metagenome]|uniref:Uncharacterized protein n=1 Tax=marine sediment metagenome TaxID=412755 RepID=X1CZS3_9ZZZZ
MRDEEREKKKADPYRLWENVFNDRGDPYIDGKREMGGEQHSPDLSGKRKIKLFIVICCSVVYLPFFWDFTTGAWVVGVALCPTSTGYVTMYLMMGIWLGFCGYLLWSKRISPKDIWLRLVGFGFILLFFSLPLQVMGIWLGFCG